jgi:hypothetical protein
MSTLPADQIVPDGVAKRLAQMFNIYDLAATGAIHAADAEWLADAQPSSACRDQHGFYADRRALLDYIDRYGPRTTVQGWNRLAVSTDTVPWSYGR